jgi:hypothetical protein
MAVLRTIVQASVLSMLDTRHDLSLGCTVAGQLVRDPHTRSDALLLKKLAQQPLGRFGVATALNQDVEHDSVLIHGSSQPVLSTRNADHNLVQVPLVSGCRKTPADLVGKALTELQRPLPHRFMTDHDPSGGEHLLDHAQAERKSEIQPHSMADDFSRESVTGVARMARWFHPLPMPRSDHPLVNLTVPA